MKLICRVLLLLSVSFSVAAEESQQAITWLERLSDSLQNRNFSTSFVVVKNNQAEPYHWFHGISEEGEQLEILSLLNGPRRDTLKKGAVVSYIEPELPPYSVKAPHISGPIPAILSGDIAALAKNYEFVTVGRSRILGRVAQLIRITSKDQHRFGYWLWLDQETSLILKTAIVTRKGQVLEQVQFTHLDITDELSENLIHLQQAQLPQVLDLSKTVPTNPLNWRVKWVPEGFKQTASNRHRIAMTKEPAEFVMFSDGLVEVSVYVSQSEDKNRAAQYVMDGAITVLNQATNGFEIGVVGKVPASTARAIADSIEFVK